MNYPHLLDVVIVGAGHAGLSASYYLKKHGLEHIVFERGKVGESWRSQRWDSFKLNTPNKLNTLPGDLYKGNEPEGFCSAKEFISSFENYVASFQLPVVENASVISIEKKDEAFIITVSQNNVIRQYQCLQVIIASGTANEKRIPSFAPGISKDVKQLHTCEYRNPSQLPNGAILVTGGAQSGIQIAEDLTGAGKKVYFSTSMVARVPRRYRGKDIHDWLIEMKFFDSRKEDIADPAMLKLKPPHLTGVGERARTISLQSLAKKGITILGKMENANEKNVFFQPYAAIHVKFADGFSAKVKGMIDEFIIKNQLKAPPPEIDSEDRPDINADCASTITSLNPEEHNIRSIVWTTGFSGNFSYIKLPVFDNDGNPKHQDGITDVKGLYFIGLPWLRSRKSTILFGLKGDAEFIAGKVLEYAHDKKSISVTYKFKE
jgi:putative flavoprotein involved in K+ transport